jgi:Na+/H+-dicarboxylate symporter
MILKALRLYNKTPMSTRIISAFMYGAMIGLFVWGAEVEFNLPTTLSKNISFTLKPFGIILIGLLQLLIVPFVFCTVARAATKIKSADFAKITWRLILWFLVTSLLAAGVGTIGALIIGPGSGNLTLDIQALPLKFSKEISVIAGAIPENPSPAGLLTRIFRDPIGAGIAGRYLAIMIIALFFGLAMKKQSNGKVIAVIDDVCAVLKKINHWITNYAPIGVFTLAVVLFSTHGGIVFSEYAPLIFAITICVGVMMYVVYPLLLLIFAKLNPIKVISQLHQTAFTAFTIISPELTLPMAVDVSEKNLGIRREVAEYSLPLGLMLNNDGICLMIPFLTIMAANTAGRPVEWVTMFVIVAISSLASFFCVTKGSGLVLFTLILSAMNLPVEVVVAVIALVCGIFPIIRMLGSLLGITGNMVCTCIVAKTTGNMTDELPDK